MRIITLKTKEAVKCGVGTMDTVFRQDKFDLGFKEGFFSVRQKTTSFLIMVPAANVLFFEVEAEPEAERTVKKKAA